MFPRPPTGAVGASAGTKGNLGATMDIAVGGTVDGRRRTWRLGIEPGDLSLWGILTKTLPGGLDMAVEEPAYRSVATEGAFEIRDYPALIVAEVSVTGEQKEAARKGFRLLAAYIFGGNRRKQSIAMTAPVTQETAGETIAMTAPVTKTRTAEE